MECDLDRLHRACTVAAKRVDQEREFQMAIHGMKPQRRPPPNLKPQDRDKRMRESFAALPTRVVRRGDAAAAQVAIRNV